MSKLIDALSSPRRNTRDLSRNILITLSLALLFTVINPNFIDRYSLISIGQNLAPYALLALGVLMPISMGGTDLSIGAVCIGSAVIGGTLYGRGWSLGACIPVMIAFGCLIGALNGYLVAKRKLQPFIATLGTMMFVRGTTAIFANKANVSFPVGTWYNNIFSIYQGYPASFFWILLFALILLFIYRRTRIGRYLLSIGSNEKATRISGVDVDKYIIIGYIGAGLMAGIASVFWSASFATITVATGNGMELDAIAAVYIGGTAATGGLANVFGSVIGSVMLVIIRNGLNFALARLNVPINSTYVTYVISGIIVIVAVMSKKTKDGRVRKTPDPKKIAAVRLASYVTSFVVLCILVVIGVNVRMDGGKDGKERDTICILMLSEGSDFWNEVTAGARAAGEKFGHRIICRGAEGEDASYLPKQREIMSTMLSEDPAGIGMATIADGFSDLLVNAYNRNVPIVQFDVGIHEEDLAFITSSDTNPLASYVVASSYDNASLLAEKTFPSIRDEMAASDEYVVGIIQHSNSVSAEERARGFSDTIKRLAEEDPATKGKCKVLIEVKPSEANNAYKDALEYLFEKDVRLVFATNIYAIHQCADAVQSSGGKYDGVCFLGYDDGDKIREWMNSDSKAPLLGSISQNPYMMGYLTVKTIIDVNDGKDVDETIIVPGEWIHPDK